MKPYELFEMLTDIDDKFIDDAMPESKNTDVIQPQKIHMTKRRFPWGIATAACLAVCVAVGVVIAVNAGKGKIPVESNSSAQSTPLTTIIKEAEEIYTETGNKELPLSFSIEELDVLPHFQIRDDKTIIRLSKIEMNIDGWEVFSNKVYVRSVYLCDLNPSLKGDNYRELVAAVTDENGNKSIRAYDFVTQKEYEFKVEDYESRWHYDSLTLKDGSLYLCTEDGSAVSQDSLTLSDMKAITQVDTVYTGSEQLPLEFIVAEVDLKFEISENKYLSLINWGAAASMDDWYSMGIMLEGTSVRRVFLCDLNADNVREIVAEVTDEDGENFIWAYNIPTKTEYVNTEFDALKVDGGALYLTYILAEAQNAEPLTLSQLTAVPHVDTIYTGSEQLPLEFGVDEAARNFRIDEYGLSVLNWGEMDAWDSSVILPGKVHYVYLCDLNGDERREIIAEVTSEDDEKLIWAFDILAETKYKTTDYDSLVIGYGNLLYLVDGESESRLSLDDFDEVRCEIEFDETEMVGIYSPDNLSLKLPRYFKVNQWGGEFVLNEDGELWHNGDVSTRIFANKTVRSAWAADLNADGVCEIVAAVSEGDSKSIVAYDHKTSTEYVYNGDCCELALDSDGLHAWRVGADETHDGDPNPLTIDQFTAKA